MISLYNARKGKKCAFYLRTNRNQEHRTGDHSNHSIDSQKEYLSDWASREGMEVVGVYSDAGKSGNSISGRDEFQRMLNDVVTHEIDVDYVMVSKDAFEQVQKSIASRRRTRKSGATQIFAGLLKCADCGWALAFSTNKQGKTPRSFYHCGKNGKGLRQCTLHYIRYEALYAVVLSQLQCRIQSVHQNEEEVRRQLLRACGEDNASAANRAQQELKRCDKRLKQLDSLFAKIYEDQLTGKITDRNFRTLSEKYQKEQGELEEKMESLTAQLNDSRQQTEGVDKWIALAKKFSTPTELTAELLNTLIEKILVHEAVKDTDGNKEQKIEIYYRFIGKID